MDIVVIIPFCLFKILALIILFKHGNVGCELEKCSGKATCYCLIFSTGTTFFGALLIDFEHDSYSYSLVQGAMIS